MSHLKVALPQLQVVYNVATDMFYPPEMSSMYKQAFYSGGRHAMFRPIWRLQP